MKLKFAFREKKTTINSVKLIGSSLWLLICRSLCANNAVIEKDFTPDQVVETLGKPMGIINLKDKTLYLYPQGDVTIKAGVVSDFEIMETEKLRKETEQLRNSTRYGLRYYTDPVIHPRPHYYRPPTVTIHSNGTTTRTNHNDKVFFFQRGSNHSGDNSFKIPTTKQFYD